MAKRARKKAATTTATEPVVDPIAVAKQAISEAYIELTKKRAVGLTHIMKTAAPRVAAGEKFEWVWAGTTIKYPKLVFVEDVPKVAKRAKKK